MLAAHNRLITNEARDAMTDEIGRRWHDMGGLNGDTVNPETHDFALWEKRVDALQVITSTKGLFTVDGLRRVLEDMGEEAFETMSYYERWTASVNRRTRPRPLRQSGSASLWPENRQARSLPRPFHHGGGLGKRRRKPDRYTGCGNLRPLARKARLMPHDHHDHDHLSPSGHPYRADQDAPLTYWQTMEIAMRELLVEKGVTTQAEITAQIEAMDRRSPADGAKVIACAWSEPDFKTRLLKDGRQTLLDEGYELGPMNLIVVENTPQIHNVIVCTLCSCYPRNLLGLPPDWYKQRAYRARVVKEPRKVLSEFGLEIEDDVQVRVHDSTADMRYIVLPERPKNTENMTPDALSELVTRDSMIGVARASSP